MKIFLRLCFSVVFTIFVSFGIVYTWNGLIAENGDYITLAKWNELVTTMLNQDDILAGNNITVTNSGTQVVIASTGGGGGTVPYITTTVARNVAPSTTVDITIDGVGFQPSSTINIPGFDGTINTVTPVSPSEIQFNITTGTNQTQYDIVVDNGGFLSSSWTGNGSNLLNIIPPVYGTGPAGTYTETFEANNLGNWTDVAGLDSTFTISSTDTPSAQTGPNSAAGGTHFIFTETSNPFNPSNTFAVETTYFRKATGISFDYHMHGLDMGNLVVQTLNSGIWTDVYNLNGQQQVNQGDPWLNTGVIDLNSYQVEAIRIFFTGGAGYRSDASIDNIVVTSTN